MRALSNAERRQVFGRPLLWFFVFARPGLPRGHQHVLDGRAVQRHAAHNWHAAREGGLGPSFSERCQVCLLDALWDASAVHLHSMDCAKVRARVKSHLSVYCHKSVQTSQSTEHVSCASTHASPNEKQSPATSAGMRSSCIESSTRSSRVKLLKVSQLGA